MLNSFIVWGGPFFLPAHLMEDGQLDISRKVETWRPVCATMTAFPRDMVASITGLIEVTSLLVETVLEFQNPIQDATSR